MGAPAEGRVSKRKAVRDNALEHNPQSKRALYHCNYCQRDISSSVRVKCAVCTDYDMCLQCFSLGLELFPHRREHDFRVIDDLSFPLFHLNWAADEEQLLLEAIDMFGLGNWASVAEHVGSKDAAECQSHYFQSYINCPTAPLPKLLPDVLSNKLSDTRAKGIVLQSLMGSAPPAMSFGPPSAMPQAATAAGTAGLLASSAGLHVAQAQAASAAVAAAAAAATHVASTACVSPFGVFGSPLTAGITPFDGAAAGSTPFSGATAGGLPFGGAAAGGTTANPMDSIKMEGLCLNGDTVVKAEAQEAGALSASRAPLRASQLLLEVSKGIKRQREEEAGHAQAISGPEASTVVPAADSAARSGGEPSTSGRSVHPQPHLQPPLQQQAPHLQSRQQPQAPHSDANPHAPPHPSTSYKQQQQGSAAHPQTHAQQSQAQPPPHSHPQSIHNTLASQHPPPASAQVPPRPEQQHLQLASQPHLQPFSLQPHAQLHLQASHTQLPSAQQPHSQQQQHVQPHPAPFHHAITASMVPHLTLMPHAQPIAPAGASKTSIGGQFVKPEEAPAVARGAVDPSVAAAAAAAAAVAAGTPVPESSGYNVKRHEFDPEYDNDAEAPIADLEFLDTDSEADRQLKLAQLAVYNDRLSERERRRNFIVKHGLLTTAQHAKRSAVDREAHHRLRVFCRYQHKADHDEMVEGLLLEQKMRARIEELKEYRRAGLRTFAEAEAYDVARRKSDDGAAAAAAGPLAFSRQGSGKLLDPAALWTTQPSSGLSLSGLRPHIRDAKEALAAWRAGRGVALDITGLPGVELLSRPERELCTTARLLPPFYLALKDMMMRHSAQHGSLSQQEVRSLHAAGALRLDLPRALRVHELLVQCGWVSPGSGDGPPRHKVAQIVGGPSAPAAAPAGAGQGRKA